MDNKEGDAVFTIRVIWLHLGFAIFGGSLIGYSFSNAVALWIACLIGFGGFIFLFLAALSQYGDKE